MSLCPSDGPIFVKFIREGPSTVVVLSGSIARADLPDLCDQARRQFEGSEERVVFCDAGAVIAPDAVAVDAVARLHLTAKRLGCELRLQHACARFEELIALAGLSDVLKVVGR